MNTTQTLLFSLWSKKQLLSVILTFKDDLVYIKLLVVDALLLFVASAACDLLLSVLIFDCVFPVTCYYMWLL